MTALARLTVTEGGGGGGRQCGHVNPHLSKPNFLMKIKFKPLFFCLWTPINNLENEL